MCGHPAAEPRPIDEMSSTAVRDITPGTARWTYDLRHKEIKCIKR